MSAEDAALAAAEAMDSMPIVTVNLWYDRAVMDDAFVGLPGRTMQWVFEKRIAFGERASHLSLVASGAEASVARTNGDLIRDALDEVVEALPDAQENLQLEDERPAGDLVRLPKV